MLHNSEQDVFKEWEIITAFTSIVKGFPEFWHKLIAKSVKRIVQNAEVCSKQNELRLAVFHQDTIKPLPFFTDTCLDFLQGLIQIFHPETNVKSATSKCFRTVTSDTALVVLNSCSPNGINSDESIINFFPCFFNHFSRRISLSPNQQYRQAYLIYLLQLHQVWAMAFDIYLNRWNINRNCNYYFKFCNTCQSMALPFRHHHWLRKTAR